MGETLSEIVGSQNIDDLSSHTSLCAIDGMIPRVALFPGNMEEVSQILALSSREKESVILRGNGTKMGWGNIPLRVDWVISTNRLNRITDCDYENLTITLEAGIPLSKVQQYLRGLGRGYFIPLDPSFAQAATIGGIVATNSSGPKRHLYGTARDLILGMKVILANGKRSNWGGKTVKNVAGYDMSKLYIGSFGTLGIVGEVTFRLLPLPEKETTLVAIFGESQPAFMAALEILRSELLPSAIEVSNSRGLEIVGVEPAGKDKNVLLAIDFEGFHESVERQIRQVGEMMDSSHPLAVHLLEASDHETFWTNWRDYESIAHTHFPDLISCKVSVPTSQTGKVFCLWENMMAEKGLDLGLRCHAGSGVIHADILLKSLDPDADEFVQTLNEMRERVKALEGTMVLKRTPLPLKKRIDAWGTPNRDFSIMENLKKRFDPDRLLNPGRFVGGI
jgi:glycolate oxidase FAD binding subunit